MGKVFDGIDDSLAEWIAAQPMWFVATAPSGADGHVNVSPRGIDTLSVLGTHRVGWVDLTGSGARGGAGPATAGGRQARPGGLAAYRDERNARSLDGLPGLPPHTTPA